nr:pyrimidine reductase family protein [Streptomyces sp. DSM 41633]
MEDDTTLHPKARARLQPMRSLFPVTDLTTTAASPDREWSLDELAEAYAYP